MEDAEGQVNSRLANEADDISKASAPRLCPSLWAGARRLFSRQKSLSAENLSESIERNKSGKRTVLAESDCRREEREKVREAGDLLPRWFRSSDNPLHFEAEVNKLQPICLIEVEIQNAEGWPSGYAMGHIESV